MRSITCLTAETCLTANPGVVSSIPARSNTFVEIDHETISKVILLPSSDSRRVVVSYKRKYVHEVLVIQLVKLAQEKMWLDELTIAIDLSHVLELKIEFSSDFMQKSVTDSCTYDVTLITNGAN